MSRDHVEEPARTTQVLTRADVLVVGGGSAGVAAAVAAARSGGRVVLAERYGSLGGLATGGLIVLLLTLDDGCGRQVIAGLCQEITDRMGKHANGAIHPPPEHWGSQDPALVDDYFRSGLIWGGSPAGARVSQPSGRGSRHLGRPPHAQRDQRDPSLHGDGRGRGNCRGASAGLRGGCVGCRRPDPPEATRKTGSRARLRLRVASGSRSPRRYVVTDESQDFGRGSGRTDSRSRMEGSTLEEVGFCDAADPVASERKPSSLL